MSTTINDESLAVVNKERIKFRLYQQGEGLMFERELIEADGGMLTQVLPISSPQCMRSFIDADPYYNQLSGMLGHLYAKVEAYFSRLGV